VQKKRIKLKKEGEVMINWIIGGIIIGLTLFIIVQRIRRMRRGESGCSGCSGCSTGKSQCHPEDKSKG